MAQAFDGPVIQIQMSHLDIVRERGRIHGEPMVLRRDFDLARRELLDRVIGAAVAEPTSSSSAAHREPEHLMTEADAEHR